MRELSENELYQALKYAKSIDEDTGRDIIERFEIDQTALAQMIFGIFPDIIAEEIKKCPTYIWIYVLTCFAFFKKPSAPCPLKMIWIMNV